MKLSDHQRNRALFPRSELEKHRGKWVAFSSDGTRIVASGTTLAQVDELVVQNGEDPNQVLFERIPDSEDDIYFASEEFQVCSSSPISMNP